MSELFSPLPCLLFLVWICVFGISASSNRDDSDSLLAVLLRNKEVHDVRDVNSKKQTHSDTREHIGRRKFKSDVRNVERNNIGEEKIVETDITKDVNEENDLLLREIAAFLTLKRKSQRIWLENDPTIRGTNTTSTSTSSPLPPSTSTTTPPSTPAPTTTLAPTIPARTCHIVCFWGDCFNLCF